jgi:hypothetical protein
MLRNPRIVSIPHAAGVGLASAIALFTRLCFEFGDGNLFHGIVSTGSYLMIFGFGMIVLAVVAAGIALVAGRLIGTTVLTGLAIVVFFAAVIDGYLGSQPISRFRRLIWKEAPRSLIFHQQRMMPSFSDGTTYTFIIAGDPKTIGDLHRAAELTDASSRWRSRQFFEAHFPDVSFPEEMEFYLGGSVALACAPSQSRTFVMRAPDLSWLKLRSDE